MKISYRTNSAIKIIEQGNFYDVLLLPEDVKQVQEMKMAEKFINSCHNFKDIKIITRPFYHALQLSINKLLQSDLLNLEYSGLGTFIFKRDDNIVETYCYDFHVKDGNIERCLFFYFLGSQIYKYYNSITDDKYVMSGLNKDDPGSSIQNQLNWLFEFFLFTKYAEIETKELKPKSKKVDINCKYVNDTCSYIKILDSTWFTNLVKSDAFKVRGHFRLQPCGQALKERKLIWIKNFEKHGYTAPARKLSMSEI